MKLEEFQKTKRSYEPDHPVIAFLFKRELPMEVESKDGTVMIHIYNGRDGDRLYVYEKLRSDGTRRFYWLYDNSEPTIESAEERLINEFCGGFDSEVEIDVDSFIEEEGDAQNQEHP